MRISPWRPSSKGDKPPRFLARSGWLSDTRWRLALPFTLLFLLAMAGLSIYLSNFIENTYLADLRSKLQAEAVLLADQLSISTPTLTDQSNLDNEARHWAALENARVTIITADGKVVGESSEDHAILENHLNRPEVLEAITSGSGSSIRYSDTLKVDMMYVAASVQVNGNRVGFVRMALPLDQVQANLGHIRQTLLRATLGVILLTILLAVWIAGRTSEPLHELTQAARQMATGAMSQVMVRRGSYEIKELAQAFNDMSQQLNERIQALNSESSKLSTVLRQMTDGVLLIDAKNAIRLINPAAERMFNVKEDEVLGKPAAGVLQYYQFVELWQECQKTSQTQRISVDLRRPNLSLQGVATPLGEAMPGSILMIFQDISQIRHLETVRRDFLSNISHELRTPLASLKALTETLKEGAIEDPPAANHFLDSMDTELDALTHMVTELLELTRIESGQVPLQIRPVCPDELLSSAMERLQVQSERANLDLVLECPPGIPQVDADAPRMEQVLVNLLHNAIKFTPPGGKITLSARQQANEVVFAVKDTGMGIPPENLPRIFERFFKVDKARTKGGTGLGLAIAKHLVESHGGRIWVESVEGQGSAFYLTLPITQAAKSDGLCGEGNVIPITSAQAK